MVCGGNNTSGIFGLLLGINILFAQVYSHAKSVTPSKSLGVDLKIYLQKEVDILFKSRNL